MEDWENVDKKYFIDIIKDICKTSISDSNIPRYIPAIVSSVNDNGTINAYIPPDKSNTVSNRLNKTGVVLYEGDSIELCSKNGKLSNSWVAVKHEGNTPFAGNGHTIIDQNGNSMPPQDNLQFTGGVNVTNANGKTVVDISGGGTSDYNTLNNKPSINSIELQGNKTSSDLKLNFLYTQSTASSIWVIVHNMNKYPSVSIIDSANNQVYGDIEYIDQNSLKIIFSAAFSGKAALN